MSREENEFEITERRRLRSLDKKKIIIGIVAVAVIAAAVAFANNRGMFGEGKDHRPHFCGKKLWRTGNRRQISC